MKGLMLLSIAIAAVALIVGCAPEPLLPEITSEPGVSTLLISGPNSPPEDRTWISPSIIEVGNFHPGGEADGYITIHNGRDTASTFAIAYRLPDNDYPGYVNAPSEIQGWVNIERPLITLKARWTETVPIVLTMPEDIKGCPPRWEFWVSVVEQGQGLIETELCCRWLVRMKGSGN